MLLLLHGVTDSLESYLPLIPKLSALFHVYAIDFRGHGESGHTPHNYSLRIHVDDIKRFIDTLIGAPVLIASHSMGACIGGWLAALYPNMVHGLIIEDQGFEFPPDVKKTSFIPRRDQLFEMHASGTAFEEAVTIFGTEPISEDTTKTRFDIYGREGVQRQTRQWLQMDVTLLDDAIEGKTGAGWDAKEILSHAE